MSKVQKRQDIAPGDLPVVIYIAKSTKDPNGSLDTQRSDCLAQIDVESKRDGRRRRVLEIFEDENKSGWKANRGEGLAGAKKLATDAAEEWGEAELWVQHSDRIARGDGRTADHLAEVFFATRKVNVRLRSVQDDSNLEDAIRAVLIGERNNEDSNRKSEAVKSGKRRAFVRGDIGGGGIPDGLRVGRLWVDDRGRRRRSIEKDPGRSQIIEKMFDLSEEGLGDPSVARELNRAGLRTRGRGGSKPIPFTRRRVQDTLTNPVYAGAVVWRRGRPDEEVNWDAKHPTMIDPKRFRRLLKARAARDKAVGSNRSPKGAPHRNHALAGLARSASCDAVMRPRTSSYRRIRKDGTKARSYLCSNAADATGVCQCQPVDAEILDSHIIAELSRFLGNVEDWRERFIGDYAAERVGLERQADEARADLDHLNRVIAGLEASVEGLAADGDQANMATALDMVTKRRKDQSRAQRRVAAIERAVSEVPDEPPTDAMLDFYNSLRNIIEGRLDQAGRDSMGRVNDALKEIFQEFVIDAQPDGSITVIPILIGGRFDAPQTLYSVVSGIEEPPPLRQLDAPSPELTNVHE